MNRDLLKYYAERSVTLEKLLINCACKRAKEGDKEYALIRQELMNVPEIAEEVPSFLKICSTLQAFWKFIAEGAITAARTLLESVCKHILDEKLIPYGGQLDIPSLYNLVATHLAIAPSQQTENIFKRIAGGCSSVVEGIGALRNKYGDSHGKSKAAISVDSRHAQLAVNLSGALSVYLIETWELTK